MKRFLFILSAIIFFLFSSCNHKEHWIAIQLYQDNEALNSLYDYENKISFINIDYSKPLEVKYFLIPDCDEQISITAIEYNNDILSLISLKEPVITFKALKTGKAYIRINTKAHHSASVVELRIINTTDY